MKCPVGEWSINWLNELHKHVRPELAKQVKDLMEVLLKVRIRSHNGDGDQIRHPTVMK
jgi:hypothetical protein